VSAIVEIVQRIGVAQRDELLRVAGIAQAQLDIPEARVLEHEAQRVCEVALELSGDDALGIHCGARLAIDSFAPVTYLVAHAPTLRDGMQSLSQFQALITDQAGYEITEHDDRVTVRSLLRPEHSPRLRRFMAELSMCGFVHIVRGYHPGWQPERVSFEHAAPVYHDEYAAFFNGAECFEQPLTGFSFPIALLDGASPRKDDGMHNVLRELAEQRLTRVTHTAPYALRVRQHLVERARSADRDMDSVARGLGMSVRSLRRRLAEEGRSYAEVESEAFAILARRLLVDQALTIQQTAYQLGFCSTTSFHRAFKRAIGMTPNEFRGTTLGNARRVG
jgi:AraC-like DNA-binding protein